MKAYLILNILILFMAFNNYDKNDDNSTDTGKVVFYTNAQALLNCGPFDVEVVINNESSGIISEAYIAESQPNCTNSGSTLLIENVIGSYNYTANIGCGHGSCNGEFKIVKDSCTKIFLDIKKLNPKSD